MKIELSLHASKLKNLAGIGKGTSDPFAVATVIATQPGKEPRVIGRTEVIKNNLNPDWAHVFQLDYELGTTTKVAITIFDEVRKKENKSMGSAVFDMAEVLGARGSTKGKKVKGGGVIFVHARRSQGEGVLRLGMKGIKLKNVEGFLSKSDPFFEISRMIDLGGGQTWDNIFRSEDIHNNLNPVWKEAVISISVICGGDLDLPLKLAVFDHESSGKHKPMGEVQITVNGLIQACRSNRTLSLQKKGKECGTLQVTKASVDGASSGGGCSSTNNDDSGVGAVASKMDTMSMSAPVPAAPTTSSGSYVPAKVATPAPSVRGSNFVDYVAGGCELNVSVAIDFTGSNGDPRKPGTLHHLSGGGARNDYEKAIASILTVLAKFDSDQKFPVYGFGAKYGGIVQHCFQCGDSPEQDGVSGVLNAYRQVFSTGLIMSSPTKFDDVIQTAATKARSSFQAAQQDGNQCYTILLILTDGAVSDVQATARSLTEASDAPLSVVIVGVGNADFSGMQFLDDFSSGPQRDIVQFVEFNKHRHSSQALTSETLHEIPAQLTEFFQSKGIAANPPLARTNGSTSIDGEEEIDLSLDVTEDEIVVTGGGGDFADGFNAVR